MKRTVSSFTTSNGVTFNYYIYRNGEENMPLPMLVYLSGTDGVGNDLTKLLRIESLPSYLENGKVIIDAPCIIFAPQCPEGMKWYKMPEELAELVKGVAAKENADMTRISLTGCSLGGMGTFALSIAHPELFSCIVPVCASVEADKCGVLNHLPVWIFHGEQDDGMGFSVVEANCVINAAKGNSRMTLLPGEGHEIRHVYYDEKYNLIPWMLKQQKISAEN